MNDFEREHPTKPEAEEKAPENKQEASNAPQQSEQKNLPSFTEEEYQTEVQQFETKRDASVDEMNKVRAEIGIPPKDEDSAEIAQARQSLARKAETIKPKTLNPGDEIFYNGDFYKISNITVTTPDQVQKTWDGEKDARDREFEDIAKLLTFNSGSLLQERQKFDEKKRKELEKIMSGRQITGMLKGSAGHPSQLIRLHESEVQKVESPEQREKLVTMQKEQDEADQREMDAIGQGGTKRFIDHITGQPGKF